MGVTGQAILRALLSGEEDPDHLARLARGSLVRKQDQLQAALQGKLLPHHHVLLEELLPLISTINCAIARFDREIAERLGRFDALIERIDAVTGLSRRSIARLAWRVGLGHEPLPGCCSCSVLGRDLSGKS